MWVKPHTWQDLRAFYRWVHQLFITSWQINYRVAVFLPHHSFLPWVMLSAALFQLNKHTSSLSISLFINHIRGLRMPLQGMHFQSVAPPHIDELDSAWDLYRAACFSLKWQIGTVRFIKICTGQGVSMYRWKTPLNGDPKQIDIAMSAFCQSNHIDCCVTVVQIQ